MLSTDLFHGPHAGRPVPSTHLHEEPAHEPCHGYAAGSADLPLAAFACERRQPGPQDVRIDILYGIVADIEMIRMEQVGEGCARMPKGDVKYRFVIDRATLDKAA